MGPYVRGTLMKDEFILYEAKITLWSQLPLILFGLFWLLLMIAIMTTDISGEINWVEGLLFFIFGTFPLIIVLLRYKTTEFAITNKRVIAKVGVLSRHSIEMKLEKVESIQVNQGILGRIFNYGSLIVSGAGNPLAPMPGISNPLNFRRIALEAQDQAVPVESDIPNQSIMGARIVAIVCITVASIAAIALIHHRPKADATVGEAALAPQQSQEVRTASPEPSNTAFVGCESDGQSGPAPVPSGPSRTINVDPALTQQLAYYESGQHLGVLAPRGWHCFAIYGSGGMSLFVSPEPIDPSKLYATGPGDFAGPDGFTGPLVELSVSDGETSGRFATAKLIARVFPDHRDFVMKVIAEGVEPEASFPFGAYPSDKLNYANRQTVEYLTPPQTDGLGTVSRLSKNDDPISGVVILTGPDFDLFHLSVRFPSAQVGLRSAIVHQLESETASQSQSVPAVATNDVSTVAESEAPKGFPVSEEVFVNAYVLANIGHDDFDQVQLAQLAHQEYRLSKDIDTKNLLLGGEVLGTRGQRAMHYLDNLSRQQQSAPNGQPSVPAAPVLSKD